MIWLWFVDTSRHTDYMLLLAVSCVDAALLLVVTIAAGFGPASAGLTVVLVALIASTWYARIAWKREEAKKVPTTQRAVKVRAPR